jgi:hypothetical protein
MTAQRLRIFDLLQIYDAYFENDENEQLFCWNDFRHVLLAWLLIKREVY